MININIDNFLSTKKINKMPKIYSKIIKKNMAILKI